MKEKEKGGAVFGLVVTRHLWQRLAILLQKGNASLLINRMPSLPVPDISGHPLTPD
jgi:hypothetical protein